MPPTAWNSITRAWLGRTPPASSPSRSRRSARHHLPARRHIQHEYGQLQPTAQPSALRNGSGDTQVLFNGQPAPCFWFRRTDQLHGPHERAHQRHGDVAGGAAIHRPDSDRRAGGYEHGFSGRLRRRSVNCSLAGGKCRQAAVVNAADGTVNSPANPAAAGSYISIYATGQGFVQGAPADGDIPRGGWHRPRHCQGFYQRLLRGRCGLHRGNRRRERPIFRTLAAVSGSLAITVAHSQEHRAGRAGSPIHRDEQLYQPDRTNSRYITTIAVKNQ